MALRFLADHCVPNSVIQTLRAANHEVLRVTFLPVESPDARVIAKTQEVGASLLSLNGDFPDIVTYPPESYKGIVALQVRNHAEIPSAPDGLKGRRYIYFHGRTAGWKPRVREADPSPPLAPTFLRPLTAGQARDWARDDNLGWWAVRHD